MLCPKWDPRAPNVRDGLKLMEEALYFNKENEKVFPKGSIIAGFQRQKNVWEMIAPTKPERLPTVAGEKGCFPCNAPRACVLHQAGTLQQVNHVMSRYDGTRHNINRRIDCSTPNIVYYILCDCGNVADYVGSTKDMKRRWSKHKYDIRNSNWTACGLTSHFGRHHRGDMEEAIGNLKVTLVDSVEEIKNLKRKEDNWMSNLGTLFVGLNTWNEVLSNNRINFGGGNRAVGI